MQEVCSVERKGAGGGVKDLLSVPYCVRARLFNPSGVTANSRLSFRGYFHSGGAIFIVGAGIFLKLFKHFKNLTKRFAPLEF